MESIVHASLASSPFEETVRLIQGVLLDVVGDSAKSVRAEWSLVFKHGEPRIRLSLADTQWEGQAEADLDPAELKDVRDAGRRLLRVWGTVLQDASKKHLARLEAIEI